MVTLGGQLIEFLGAGDRGSQDTKIDVSFEWDFVFLAKGLEGRLEAVDLAGGFIGDEKFIIFAGKCRV